jgi:hypothetical protein
MRADLNKFRGLVWTKIIEESLQERSSRTFALPLSQGVTKRCRLSWLTNSALVCEPKRGGGGGSCVVSANGYGCTVHTGAQINFGDLTPY